MTRGPRTVDLDRVMASTPVNAGAARAVGRGGEPPVLAKRPRAYHNQHAPEPTKTPSRRHPDLTGMRFGRFTVVGFLGKLNWKKKGMWLVRCACGAYEHRRTAAIKNLDGRLGDRCIDCQKLASLKRKDSRRRTGRWPSDAELER